jgi:hypothetical protein
LIGALSKGLRLPLLREFGRLRQKKAVVWDRGNCGKMHRTALHQYFAEQDRAHMRSGRALGGGGYRGLRSVKEGCDRTWCVGCRVLSLHDVYKV